MLQCQAQSARQTPVDLAATPEAAVALEQQGKFSEAESAWCALLKTHPQFADAYAHLALIEARQERYKEAVPLYRKALALNPAMPGLRLNLGLALFKGQELKQAIVEFQPLLKAQAADSPERQRLIILIGMAYYGLTEYASAAPYLKEAAQNDAQNLPLRLALAHSCLWSKQYQCVLNTYREILTLNPASAEADMLAGEASDELKDDVAATQMFRDAVKADPKEPNVHFGLGYLLWAHKQYTEAISEFEAELENDPKHAQSMVYIADTYIQMNKDGDALPLLKKAIEINPSLALAHLDLGIVDSETGRKEDALRELTIVEKMTPDDVNVHWRLARLYRTLGNKDQAKAEFDKASTITKSTDDALLKRMQEGSAHPPQSQTPPSAPPTEK